MKILLNFVHHFGKHEFLGKFPHLATSLFGNSLAERPVYYMFTRIRNARLLIKTRSVYSSVDSEYRYDFTYHSINHPTFESNNYKSKGRRPTACCRAYKFYLFYAMRKRTGRNYFRRDCKANRSEFSRTWSIQSYGVLWRLANYGICDASRERRDRR